MRVVIVAGTTLTAWIPGISAAGASPELVRHTPAADAEIVAYGCPVFAPSTPASPSGCPTPAVITRAVRELIGFDLLVLDAGLDAPTAAPVVPIADRPGRDVRGAAAVPAAADIVENARELGRSLPDEELVVGETIPGGTTTALGVLAALGEPYGVSSSLRENPIERKRAIVRDGLAESGLEAGGAAGEPVRAIELMGDPVLAAVTGLIRGALERGATVTLAGGTQLLAVGALLRHGDVTAPIEVATTPFVLADESAEVERAAAALDLDLTVTDPDFDGVDHPALTAYVAGEGKEGVGMGGALRLAEREGLAMSTVRAQVIRRSDRLLDHDGS